MKEAVVLDEYVSWIKNDYIYKYVLQLIFPIYLFNILLWYLFSFVGPELLGGLAYLGYLLFSIVRVSKVSWVPKKRSVLKPLLVALLYFVFSFFPLYACLSPEINGPFSEFFWGGEKRKPVSWALFMSGAFGVVYIGVSYFKAAHLNLKGNYNV